MSATEAASESAKPTNRDVVLGSESKEHVMNGFLLDLIRLHRIIYVLEEKEAPTKDEDVKEITDHVYSLVTEGKDYMLAGVRTVPTPFMTSKGRFFDTESKEEDKEITYTHKELSEENAKEKLTKLILEEFAKPLDGVSDKESPYKEYKDILDRYPAEPKEETEEAIVPSAKDAILIDSKDTRAVADRIQEHELGNKVIFNMASQVVTAYTTSVDKRVEAALAVMHSLDDAQVVVSNPLTPEGAEAETAVPPPTQKARFLIRKLNEEERSTWALMDAVSASFLLLCFVFEVYLQKGIDAAEAPSNYPEVGPASTGAVDNPTDWDVLFGRGGLTNQHPGNKRFRDVIALHRPDYIRAIKMDKPAVARKIVRTIRNGDPPGRFLKKHDDGKWYDVGDRTAAEKTSQGLRERSNAEKRQRHALREALRIRKQDMSEGGEGEGGEEGKKAAAAPAPAPLPILNYVGTNLAVPLSLGMKEPPRNTVKRRKTENGAVSDELNTEGLPPNAVDEEGNILVTDYDILCGRGGLTNHHKGNKRFRDIVALHRPDYVRAPKIQKPSVARVIVRAIRNGDPPGRFLRKDDKSGKWIDIGDKKAAEKTSQALREKTNEEREKQRKEPGSASTPVTGISLLPGTTDFLAAAGAMMAKAVAPNNVVVTKTDASKTDDKEEGNESKEEGKPAAADEAKTEAASTSDVKDPTADMPAETPTEAEATEEAEKSAENEGVEMEVENPEGETAKPKEVHEV